jgi:hypothetical protein
MAKRCLVKDMGIRFSHLLPNIFLPTLGAEPLNSPLVCFMEPVSSYHTEIQAGMAKAREVPHTDWVMNLYGWTGILLLILCLVPAVWLAWKSENFRVLWRSIRWGWAGLFIWHLWMGLIAPLIVIEWMGADILAEAFPSNAIIPMALFGWFGGAIISFPVCSLGILWRCVKGRQNPSAK